MDEPLIVQRIDRFGERDPEPQRLDEPGRPRPRETIAERFERAEPFVGDVADVLIVPAARIIADVTRDRTRIAERADDRDLPREDRVDFPLHRAPTVERIHVQFVTLGIVRSEPIAHEKALVALARRDEMFDKCVFTNVRIDAPR